MSEPITGTQGQDPLLEDDEYLDDDQELLLKAFVYANGETTDDRLSTTLFFPGKGRQRTFKQRCEAIDDTLPRGEDMVSMDATFSGEVGENAVDAETLEAWLAADTVVVDAVDARSGGGDRRGGGGGYDDRRGGGGGYDDRRGGGGGVQKVEFNSYFAKLRL